MHGCIYRNAKGVKGRGVDGGAFDNNMSVFSCNRASSAQQPTLVAFSGTEANLDAALTPPGVTTRTSTDAVGGSAPGDWFTRQNRRDWGRHPAPQQTLPRPRQRIVFSVTPIVEAGTPGLSAETSSFQTTLSGDIHVRTLIPRRATFRAELTNVLTRIRASTTPGLAALPRVFPQLTPTLASTWQRIALATVDQPRCKSCSSP